MFNMYLKIVDPVHHAITAVSAGVSGATAVLATQQVALKAPPTQQGATQMEQGTTYMTVGALVMEMFSWLGSFMVASMIPQGHPLTHLTMQWAVVPMPLLEP